MVHSEKFIKELENIEKNQMKNSMVEIKNILEEMIIRLRGTECINTLEDR